MKLVYTDLINLLSEKPSKQLLSDKLFQLGHEHEIHGDIFEMELTPNRGDCLSLIGLARDLKVFFGNSKAIDIFEEDFEQLDISFKNLSPDDCPKVSFLEIEIEESTSDYKPYLNNYFDFIGGNKTNLFTDISNYISYELGQPTHCFDREAINGCLVFQNMDCDSLFKTLLGSEIQLKNNNCVFSVDDEIISLAGVMGGASTACNSKTKKVLIECAYFNPESIIGKTIKYNLTSDAAHKFERGVDIDSHEKVLRRFAKVVSDHSKIISVKFKTFISDRSKDKLIPFNSNEINRVLGTEISEKRYLSYLNSLGFTIEDNKIKIPSYRNDIKTQNDMAEEIARVIGYNNIRSIPINFKKISNNKKCNKISTIESFFYKSGFSQVINFPFTSKKEPGSIKIDNPLDSNRENFRTSLQNSLVENLLYNERRQKDSIKFFEISNIYTRQGKIKQQKKLGLIITGRLGNNHEQFSKKADYSYINQLLNMNLENEIFKIIEISRTNLETKKKDKIFYSEILIDDIPDHFFSNLSESKKAINFISYKPISDFPSSTRDFSFSIINPNIVNKVIGLLENTSDEILRDSFIFDFYKNDKQGVVKLGYRFIFQSYLKTLSDEEINIKVKEIIQPILELEGVSIPGM